MSKETQCTGCGATVTQGQDGNILDLPDFRDVTGSLYCLTTNELMRWPYARHSIELPPVAIKPESAQLIAYSVFWMNGEPRSAVVIAQDLGDCLRIASTYGEVKSIHRENGRVILDVMAGAGL